MMKKKKPTKQYVIYCATNIINQCKYIGATDNFIRRKREHINDANNMANPYPQRFHKAIREFGIESFEWKFIRRGLSLEEASKQEKFYILKYQTTLPWLGYNYHLGGLVINKPGPRKKLPKHKKKFGEQHHNSKITDKQVLAIFQEYAKCKDAKKVAEKFAPICQVNPSTIRHILIGRNRRETIKKFKLKPIPKEKNLTDKQVLQIRKLIIEDKLTYNEIGKLYNITKSVVFAIASRRSYKELLNGMPIIRRGRRKGEQSSSSKLTQKQADQIRKEFDTGKYLIKDLAKKYEVSQQTISRIVRNIMYVSISIPARK